MRPLGNKQSSTDSGSEVNSSLASSNVVPLTASEMSASGSGFIALSDCENKGPDVADTDVMGELI